jgi:uncharacterized membrane protein
VVDARPVPPPGQARGRAGSAGSAAGPAGPDDGAETRGPALEPDETAERPTRQWGDLVAIALLAMVGLAATGAPAPIRIPLGMLAALFVPGYALIAAIFPTDEQIDMLERLGLALAGSFGLIVVQALVLDRLPNGLSPEMIRAVVTSSSIALLFVAAVRRARWPGGGRVWKRSTTPLRTTRAGRFTRAIAVASLVIAALAYVLTTGRPAPTPTEFYLLGPNSQLSRYPRSATVGERFEVRVGVNQSSGSAGRYRVTARNGETVLASSPPIALNPAGRWEDVLTVAMERPGPDQELAILLEREGDARPYRSLRLWLDVRPAGSG